MTLRSALLGTAAVAAIASTVAAVSLVGAGPALAQATAAPANPTMTNVIPDAGNFAVAGKSKRHQPRCPHTDDRPLFGSAGGDDRAGRDQP